MKTTDVFVLSSAWEGFGNVLVEALDSGANVVATDCRHGPREILENGRFGTLVEVGDHDALAVAIMSQASNPEGPNQELEAHLVVIGWMRCLKIIPMRFTCELE